VPKIKTRDCFLSSWRYRSLLEKPQERRKRGPLTVRERKREISRHLSLGKNLYCVIMRFGCIGALGYE
jgi:ribosomal protein S21